MRKFFLYTLFALFVGVGTISTVGCNEGPLEEAGEELDDEIDDATDG